MSRQNEIIVFLKKGILWAVVSSVSISLILSLHFFYASYGRIESLGLVSLTGITILGYGPPLLALGIGLALFFALAARKVGEKTSSLLDRSVEEPGRPVRAAVMASATFGNT